MERGMNKVVIVTRKTRLKELIYKYNTVEQVKFYLEHLGADFSDYVEEDKKYERAVKKVMQTAEKYARVQEIDRGFVPNMIFLSDRKSTLLPGIILAGMESDAIEFNAGNEVH